MSEPAASPNRGPQSVTFHYIKGQNFKVVHVDGAVGGITPSGLIHMAVYSERTAIPQMLVHRIDDAGSLGDVIEQISKPGIVREMETDLIFSRDVAQAIHKWLTDKLAEYDQLRSMMLEQGGGE